MTGEPILRTMRTKKARYSRLHSGTYFDFKRTALAKKRRPPKGGKAPPG